MTDDTALRVCFRILISWFIAVVPIAPSVNCQPRWQQTNGPYGGKIHCLTINDHGDVFAGGVAGVFRSKNRGLSWQQIRTDSVQIDFRSLAANSSGLVLAGTATQGILYSIDDGTHWQTAAVEGTAGNALIINGSGAIFAGTDSGAFRSTNGGGEWVRIISGLTNRYVTAFGVSGTGLLFAGTSGGMFRSSDMGETWVRTSVGMTDTAVRSIAVGANGFMFSATSTTVFRSSDDGDTWVDVGGGLANADIWALAIDSSGVVFAGAFGLFGGPALLRSTNVGSTWEEITTGIVNPIVWTLTVSNSGQVFAGTEGDGVYGTTNAGATWSQVGVPGCYVWAIASSLNDVGLVFASTESLGPFGGRMYKSTDFGNTWALVNSGLNNSYVHAIAIDSGHRVFAGSDYQGVFRTTNNGEAWVQVLPSVPATSLCINSNDHIFAGGYQGMHRSTDNGNTWTAVNNGLTNHNVESIVIGTNGFVYAGTTHEGPITGGVFRSTDNGTTWLFAGLTNNTIACLAVNSEGYLFAGSASNGVFLSMDNGVSWEQINSGLNYSNISCLAANRDGELFAGTYDVGMFRTTNNGGVWTQTNDGLTNPFVTSVVTSVQSRILVGTGTSGMFRTADTSTDVKPVLSEVPTEFALAQNYPNPFNPTTTINYDLPKDSRVSLKVFNILGQEVATLVSTEQKAGHKSIEWNANGVGSGVYFYLLQAGDFVASKKLLLLK